MNTETFDYTQESLTAEELDLTAWMSEEEVIDADAWANTHNYD